ncbi:MAG TPA: VTT domain-containing protein, partial [Thiotrichales bacterium]|nr:VTT domain-containing protein [Thiotrichales bacterium]
PPDVLLIPMVLARPDDAWRLAWLTTWTSVLGALLGYALGYFAIELLMPYLQEWGYVGKLEQAKDFFADYGIWAVFLGAFTPLPFKVITVTAGMLDMSLLPFVLVALLGRGQRFFLIAGVMKYGGVRALPIMQKYADALGWLVVSAVIIGLVIWNSVKSV